MVISKEAIEAFNFFCVVASKVAFKFSINLLAFSNKTSTLSLTGPI